MDHDGDFIERESRWLDLRVRGSSDLIDQALADLERDLPTGWVRDSNIEQRLRDRGLGRPENRIYSYRDAGIGPVASVTVGRIRPDEVKGGQTVPLGGPNIPYSVHARAVVEFMDNVFIPCMNRAGLNVEFVERPHPVETAFSYDAHRELEQFAAVSQSANGGAAHDELRLWHAFLIAAHRSPRVASRDELEDWLSKRGFSPNRVRELGAEYGRGLSLLDEYEQRREHAWR